MFKNRCSLLVCAEIKRFYLHSLFKKSFILGCISHYSSLSLLHFPVIFLQFSLTSSFDVLTQNSSSKRPFEVKELSIFKS